MIVDNIIQSVTMTKQEKVKNRCISCDTTLVHALEQMDSHDCKLLLVFKDGSFHSILSIGDIQRAIIRGVDLDEKIHNVLRANVKVGYEQDSQEYLKDMMQKFRMELLPILSRNGELKEILFWDEVYHNEEQEVSKLDTPVVIMAGGKGTRLKPVTNIIPKPLIPLGDKPIIELIADSFAKAGVTDFFVSVNYKKEMIKRYFDEIPQKKYKMHYFEENEPLGTGGSLHLLNGKLNKTFFVTNCDILINQDYAEILDYHYQNKNELTLVAAIKHYSIPYGTVVAGPGGILKTFREKPEIKYLVNAGMYILEPHLLKEVPENCFYHITELIEKVKDRGGNVGVFPVSEGSWMDIGEWKEYNTTMNKLGFSS
jgi:dTDP-glucose pyrophosphorylase